MRSGRPRWRVHASAASHHERRPHPAGVPHCQSNLQGGSTWNHRAPVSRSRPRPTATAPQRAAEADDRFAVAAWRQGVRWTMHQVFSTTVPNWSASPAHAQPTGPRRAMDSAKLKSGTSSSTVLAGASRSRWSLPRPASPSQTRGGASEPKESRSSTPSTTREVGRTA